MCDWALRSEKNSRMPALSAHIRPMSSEHITYTWRVKCFLTYWCLALAMRDVFVNVVALLTRNAMAKRCVFADLYTWFIYNTLYIRLKTAGSSYILTKFLDAQRRTALFFVTQGVGCGSCMCDWGIRVDIRISTNQRIDIWVILCTFQNNKWEDVKAVQLSPLYMPQSIIIMFSSLNSHQSGW